MTSVQTPEDMSPTLAAAYNARDLDTAAALYEDEAVLIDETDAAHQGSDAIRAALKDMLEDGGVMTSTLSSPIRFGAPLCLGERRIGDGEQAREARGDRHQAAAG